MKSTQSPQQSITIYKLLLKLHIFGNTQSVEHLLLFTLYGYYLIT
jgi:hypothetical protein